MERCWLRGCEARFGAVIKIKHLVSTTSTVLVRVPALVVDQAVE